jgi:hypothetical protein
MQQAFQRLRRLAQRGRWTHRTPVPSAVFDPDYEPPAAQKPWWKFWI